MKQEELDIFIYLSIEQAGHRRCIIPAQDRVHPDALFAAYPSILWRLKEPLYEQLYKNVYGVIKNHISEQSRKGLV